MMQEILTYLVRRTGKHETEHAGLPTYYDPHKLWQSELSQEEGHAKRDIEFFTRLEDEISDVRRVAFNQYATKKELEDLSIPYDEYKLQGWLLYDVGYLAPFEREKLYDARFRNYLFESPTLAALKYDSQRYNKFARELYRAFKEWRDKNVAQKFSYTKPSLSKRATMLSHWVNRKTGQSLDAGFMLVTVFEIQLRNGCSFILQV